MSPGMHRTIKKTVSIGSRWFPSVFGSLAFQLFTRPSPKPVTAVLRPNLRQTANEIIGRAEQCRIPFGKSWLQGYRWAPTDDHPAQGQTVLIVHGWTSESLYMTGIADYLSRHGFTVTALDMPAHGRSPGRQLMFPDAMRSVLTASTFFGGADAWIGHSFGCPVLTMSALERSESGPQQPAAKVVFLAPPDTLRGVTERFSKLIGLTPRGLQAYQARLERAIGHSMDELQISRYAQELLHELLVIHDQDDPIVPFADAEAIVQANREADFMVTQGLGHNRILGSREVHERIRAFLSTTL